jgi:hypothetical protein
MKKYAKILITTGIGLIVAGLIIWNSKTPNPNPTPNTKPSFVTDTTKYTDVVLINSSNLDSIQVFVTLPSTQSIVGKFGMDSTNFNPDAKNPDGSLVQCKGIFWAKKDVKYHLGDTATLNSVVITWGVDNQACTAAQAIDSAGTKLYPYGLNIFEFSVNTWYQNGKVTGNVESFDISCVDGLHSVLKESVTSFGPRNNDGLNPNFGAFWDYGYTDSTGQLAKFTSAINGITLKGCVNIAGVFPYGCDWGYTSHQPPTPCSNPSYSVECSTKWGDINTSQTNRQGQGGQVICEFLGYTRGAQPLK